MASYEIIVAMTGASGAAYGLRLIQRLSGLGAHQDILVSDAGRIVLKHETGIELPVEAKEAEELLARRLDVSSTQLSCYGVNDWFSPAASGSSGIRHMVIIPC